MAKAHVYNRDNINTDEIIPARYLNTDDQVELAKHCMEDLDAEFVKKVQSGDVIVAGEDFGCGSSREHAVWAIRGAKVAAVVAGSFARIFYRNAINCGFLVVECPGAAAQINDMQVRRRCWQVSGEIENPVLDITEGRRGTLGARAPDRTMERADTATLAMGDEAVCVPVVVASDIGGVELWHVGSSAGTRVSYDPRAIPFPLVVASAPARDARRRPPTGAARPACRAPAGVFRP